VRLGLEAGKLTLDLAAELGIRGVPVSGGAIVANGIDAALAPLRQRGLEVCQINAFGYNPLSPDAAAVERERGILERLIPLAAQTGCRYIVVGPGNYHPSVFGHHDPRNAGEAAIDALAAALRPLVLLAEHHGVCLSIEPYLKGVIHSAPSFRALHARIGSSALRANLDPSSLYGYREAVAPDAFVASLCQGLAGHYGLVHLKEIAVLEGFHLHMGLCPIGAGNTNWGQLLHLAAPHVPSDGWTIIEHVASADEAQKSLRIIRDAAAGAGVELE
jgi:sugar phosphate isomerase/epimerase